MYKGPARKFKKRLKPGRRRRITQYGTQLAEKQKMRMLYGVRERVMKNYYDKAQREQVDNDFELMKLLERRLDNVVYRAGFAITRSQARQLVNHGHILVKGVRTNISSYQVVKGDIISIRPGSVSKGIFKDLALTLPKHAAPSWLDVGAKDYKVTIKNEPVREDVHEPVDAALVTEFYSR